MLIDFNVFYAESSQGTHYILVQISAFWHLAFKLRFAFCIINVSCNVTPLCLPCSMTYTHQCWISQFPIPFFQPPKRCSHLQKGGGRHRSDLYDRQFFKDINRRGKWESCWLEIWHQSSSSISVSSAVESSSAGTIPKKKELWTAIPAKGLIHLVFKNPKGTWIGIGKESESSRH